MLYFLPNLLTKNECSFLYKEFQTQKITTPNQDNDKKTLGLNTYGFRPNNTFNDYLDILKPTINKFIDTQNLVLENVNTFVREYKTGSYLKKHIDRNDIGITLSICLYNDTNETWPLNIDYKNKIHAINSNIGDGILLFDSNKIVHWRDELKCEDNNSITQFFLHWVIRKNNKSLL